MEGHFQDQFGHFWFRVELSIDALGEMPPVETIPFDLSQTLFDAVV